MSAKETRFSILESACTLFAEKGFTGVTVAEICVKAKANIAAVNYHFQSKEGLYREVWSHAHKCSESKYPSALPSESDSAVCLKNLIRNRILAIFDSGPAGCFPRIINRELTYPSPISKELFMEFLAPRRKQQEKLISSLLGPEATAQQIRICTVNVLSVYAFLNIARKPREHIFGKKPPSPAQLDELIALTQEFVSNAVRGVRKSIKKQAAS